MCELIILHRVWQTCLFFCDVADCETNMVYFQIEEEIPLLAQDFGERLSGKGLKVNVVGPREIRLVTHYWITDTDIDQAVGIISEVMSGIVQ